MNKHDTGGTAFPVLHMIDGNWTKEPIPEFRGMTLRDYFAAKAMGIMWSAYDQGYCGLNNKDIPNATVIAQGAYQIADAMLEARK